MGYEKDVDLLDLVLDEKDKEFIGKRLAERVEDRIRRRMNNSDFGPRSENLPARYSTREAFYDITEPSGREGRFRMLKNMSEDARYVRLEGGYREFRRIYRAQSDPQVTLELTGAMKDAMSADYETRNGGFEAFLRFKNIGDLYSETTPAERARYVNEQYQFIYLDDEEQKEISKKTLRDTVRRLMKKVR